MRDRARASPRQPSIREAVADAVATVFGLLIFIIVAVAFFL